MPNHSKKGPDEPKNYNIPLEGRLHQKVQAIALAHRRSLRQEMLTCLENCLARWELESEITTRAARDRSGLHQVIAGPGSHPRTSSAGILINRGRVSATKKRKA